MALGQLSLIFISPSNFDFAYLESKAFSIPSAEKCINSVLYFLHKDEIFEGKST